MRSLLVMLFLLASATAFAQAPGEALIPVHDTPTVCATAPELVPVLDNRWSIGLALGGVALTPKGGSTPSRFGLGELAFRYRLGRHLELEAAAGAGGQAQADGTPGGPELREGVLAARWHFRPEHPWSWYVGGGIGVMSIADAGVTQQQRSDAMRPLGELGVGVERRWRHLGLAAEVTAVGIGAVRDTQAMPATTARMTTGIVDSDTAGGVQVTAGASYYF
jgi:hypothetical protein